MISICFLNQKGGAGKSSCVFHLGGYFASIGLRTLLIDADPQGSLSQGFFGSSLIENLSAGETLAALFADDSFYATQKTLITPTAFERISVIRANQTLAAFNVPEPEKGGLAQYSIREFMAGMADFDIALFDCPPNLYQCSWNALIATDYVAIPVPPEDFGTQGLRVVHQAIDNARLLNPKLSLLGHIVTRVDQRLLVHRSYEAKLRALYDTSVLATVVPESSAFKVSLACRTPVTHYGPRTRAAGLLSLLGDEILARTSIPHEDRRRA